MKLTFLGAAHEVTGSCYLLEAAGRRLVVDCGMEQGRDTFENRPLPVGGTIDAALLTHAHIDHSGLMPLLVKNGFSGPIHSTEATRELCGIMLRDSAHIQEQEAEWKQRKAKRAGRVAEPALYTTEDAERAAAQFEAHPYGQRFKIFEGIEARFTDVGHLLGSASIELWLTEGGESRKLVFSGDIGNLNQPILRDPSLVEEADYAVIESTYGDRLHKIPPDYVTALAEIVERTMARGGNLVVPSFAVGRTQELLYFLREIKERGLVGRDFRAVVDSPLAVEATRVFNQNTYGYMDDDAMEIIKSGRNPLMFEGLSLSLTTDQSRALNFDPEPKVIISASGMCEAGRIRHHLKHNLWRKECTVLFVGYQAEGTLGRALLEGARSVKLFGETIEVNAEIVNLDGVSGHADREGLLRWAAGFEKPPRFFVTHGENEVADGFAELLSERLGCEAVAPYNGECWELLGARRLAEGNRRPIVPFDKSAGRPAGTGNPHYTRLKSALESLSALVSRSGGLANSLMDRLSGEIEELVRRFRG